ncbi:hypothetical protein B1218_38465, partial [Pseudomonas ogarae]
KGGHDVVVVGPGLSGLADFLRAGAGQKEEGKGERGGKGGRGRKKRRGGEGEGGCGVGRRREGREEIGKGKVVRFLRSERRVIGPERRRGTIRMGGDHQALAAE